MQIATQMALHKALPFLVPAPALLMMHSTALPYSTLQHRTRLETAALATAAAGMAVGALTLLARLAHVA